MICACTLAGTAACNSCWNNPNGSAHSRHFVTWTDFSQLSERTCQIVKTPSDSDYLDDWRYRCSECGCNIPVNERDEETGDVIRAANYCPNCGSKVIK